MKHTTIFALSLGAVFFAVGWLVDLNLAAGSSVTVTATVAASTVTCNTDVSSIDFGTLDTGSISTATPNASTSLACNNAAGCTLNIKDANIGLATSSPAYTIDSADATLAIGTEGYGAQATTTGSGSGGMVTVATKFNKTGNDVGGLSTSDAVLASSTESTSGYAVLVTHKASISAITPAASYTDTITYSCTGN